ncbi:MAG: hypothetical protein C4308_09220 [Chitinophagaceae bacterium]
MKATKTLLLILLPFFCVAQNRYDVVIDELMADPTPQVALPNNEWIELKNTTTAPINLQGWRIGDATGQSGPMPNFILQPDSFVIVCTGSAVAALSVFGTTISVTSFPSLDNDGDQVFLKAANGKIIHAVAYNSSWYQNELKKAGGWTLEMIDTKNPCSGSSNWKASTDVKGGTPGKKNSVDALNNDATPPKLKRAYSQDSVTIVLVFDEPVDSLKGAAIVNYSIDGGLIITSAITLSPLFDKVQLKLSTPMVVNTVYTVTANNVTDCKGNEIGTYNKAKVGLAREAVAGDVVINEILFNPRSNGYDYVEYYNRSNRIIDAAKLFAANRSRTGAIASIKQISSSPFYIFPGDYLVITVSLASLQMNYLVKNADAVIELSSLPSYPDHEGSVLLLNSQGAIVDEVNYKDDWHFKLIDNAEGVSLERIDPDGSSNTADNWHSAASTAGYGTPGYKNSQYKQLQAADATVEVLPKTFSPDNDGYEDFLVIRYKVAEPGYVANITIFDSQGRTVRSLVRNATLGLNGYWTWDGLDEKGKKLAIGSYIIYTQIFNLQGKKKDFKNAVVLARRLN